MEQKLISVIIPTYMEEKYIDRTLISIKEQSYDNFEIIIADSESPDNTVEIANKYAPEHLELQIKNPDKIINKLKNYGGLFIGKYSAEVFGDYCVGPNHILPTNKAAKYTGGLSVGDFLKIQTYQKIDKCSDDLIKIATSLAEIEGLDGHKNAALIRLKGQ